jgi:hypothetical protein
MKNILTIWLALLYGLSLHAQILNDNINVEIRMAEFYGNSDNDATSTDEQSMLITYIWNDGTNVGPFCSTFDCHAPCELPESDNLFSYVGTTNREYNASIDFRLHAWGDEDGDDCIFDPGDIDEYMGLASDETLINNVITEGRPPVSWNYGFGSVNDWVFYDNSLFDLKPKACWRFSAGDNCANPLNFGTIAPGESKTHINVNKTVPGGASGAVAIGYTSTSVAVNTSPDVFYSFTIDALSAVTISTDNLGTNYDTFIGLMNTNCGNIIASNDDVSNGNTTSLIETELAAGTYIIYVEGYQGNEGTFELSVSASSIISSSNDINKELNVQISPNPTQGQLNMVFSDTKLLEDARYYLYSTSGQLLQQKVINGVSTLLDLSAYTRGIYVLKIATTEGYKVEKIVLK